MVIDGNWQSTIKYHQSPRGRDFKAFLAQPHLHSVVSERVWSILMSIQAAEALLKIPKYQILQAQDKHNFGGNKKKLITSLKTQVYRRYLCMYMCRWGWRGCENKWFHNRAAFIFSFIWNVTHKLSSIPNHLLRAGHLRLNILYTVNNKNK